MYKINKNNFKEKFEELESLIDKAAFIAIDCEFTGLYANEQQRASHADSTKERYIKCCQNAKNFIICQLGLTIAIKLPDQNKFVLHPYQFEIFPKEDTTFSVQVDAVKFLSTYKFDFNEWLYNGIPYLDPTTEREMRQKAKDGTLFSSTYLHSIQSDVEEFLETVRAWSKEKLEETLELEIPRGIDQIILMNLIAQNNKDVLVTIENETVILVNGDSSQRKQFDKELLDLNNKYIDEQVGFSKVFQLIINAKKPIIGHNMLADLFLLYQHFYKPLPNTIDKFKKEVIQLFTIYDTKHISYRLKKYQKSINTDSLLSLYLSIKKSHAEFNSIYVPAIKSSFPEAEGDKPHEAGYDAYMTAVVFIRLAHFARTRNTNIFNQIPQTWMQCLSALTEYENHVNIINFREPFWDLANKSTIQDFPPYIFVKARKEMSDKQLANAFGQYEVKKFVPLGNNRALVLVDTFKSYNNLLQDYSDDEDMFVCTYMMLRHSQTFRNSLLFCSWASCFSSIFLAWKYFKLP